MTPTVVVIPTRDQIEMLGGLIDDLYVHDDFAHLLVFDNSDTQDVEARLRPRYADGRLLIVPAAGEGIHRMWNRGWDFARNSVPGPVNVAILNDDIRVPPYFLRRLEAALRSTPEWWCVYPNYHLERDEQGVPLDDPENIGVTQTHGSFRDGGMCGWAFMLRGELLDNPLPPIDEQFIWWCGDDDLAAQIDEHGGRLGRVDGLAVVHEGSATANLHPELHDQGWQDMQAFNRKYNR